MRLVVDTSSVSEVLLQDGWHTVARSSLHLGDYARAETSTSAPATPGFTFEEKDGTIIVGPLSSILALRRAPARDERKTSE